jgi:trigger factor
MNIQVEAIGPCRKQLHIEIPADEVTRTVDEVVGGYAQYARIPGFRPGKAPRTLVQSRFKKEILKDVKEQLIPMGYQKALAQEQIQTVAVLDVTEADPVAGQPFVFQVTVETFPEFELPDYKAISIPPEPVDVTDASVDEVIDQMRNRMASFEAGPEGRAAEAGDRVVISYTATVDGAPLKELVSEHAILAEATDFGLILDKEYSFLPEFADQLLGIKAGEARSVTVSFDDQFVEKALAGKQAVYAVTVSAVEVKKLPELDAAFIKGLGVEDEASLRTRIRADLARMNGEKEQRRVQDAICKQLLEQTPMSVPESELQRRTSDEVYDLVEYNSNRGVDREAIEGNREQIFSAAAKVAEDKLKIRYALLRIAREEKLEVTDAEIQARIRLLALQARKDPEKLKNDLVKNNRIGALREDMLASKALALLESLQPAATSAA